MKTIRLNFKFLTSKLQVVLLLVFLGMPGVLQAAPAGILQSPDTRLKGNANHLFQSSHAKRDQVRKIYNSQVGVRESGANSGAEVEKYLRYVNLPKGNAWCAAFVCWVYGRAGIGNPESGWTPELFKESRVIWSRGEPRTKNQEAGLVRGQLYAYPQNYFPNNKSAGRFPPLAPRPNGFSRAEGLGGGFCTHSTPTTADIFALYFPEKRRIAHVGFIDEWNDPWLTTVEGNTNVPGSREGDGVYRKRRLVKSIYKVARYVW